MVSATCKRKMAGQSAAADDPPYKINVYVPCIINAGSNLYFFCSSSRITDKIFDTGTEPSFVSFICGKNKTSRIEC